MALRDVYIVSAARTPIGNFNGVFSHMSAADLGAAAIKRVIEQAKVNPNEVNEIIMGQALTTGAGQNPARQASLTAGVPKETPAYVINMLCGSGLKSVALGYQSIRCGDNEIVVCGGQESMTRAPHYLHLRGGVKMGKAVMLDSMIIDGLTDAMTNLHMGLTAENLAEKYRITREEQDAYAVKSQNLAENAEKMGYFEKEIVPISFYKKETEVVVNKDEYIKHGTKIEDLANLNGCFLFDGSVTAGNASGINDSAAAVLLMSEEQMKSRSVTPLAKIIAYAQVGICPKFMGEGPIGAVKAVLAKANWKLEDVDLFELNEAFAVQAITVNNALKVDVNKVNINGGAIALGHPIGASGCRVLVTLVYALQRTGKKKGIASLCVGGGMGVALAIEMV